MFSCDTRIHLHLDYYNTKKNTVVEVQVIGLVFLSCFLQAINTLDDLPSTVHRGIDAVDTVCVYIFAVEFILRWWSAGRFQLRYLAKPLASIDAVSFMFLPFLLINYASNIDTSNIIIVSDCCHSTTDIEWSFASII